MIRSFSSIVVVLIVEFVVIADVSGIVSVAKCFDIVVNLDKMDEGN